MIQQEGLIHGTGVIVQAPGDGQVNSEVFLRHAKGGQIGGNDLQLVQARVKGFVPPGVAFQGVDHLGVASPDGDKGQNFIRLSIQ